MTIKEKINYCLDRNYDITYYYVFKRLVIRNKIFVYELNLIRKIAEKLGIEIEEIRVKG